MAETIFADGKSNESAGKRVHLSEIILGVVAVADSAQTGRRDEGSG
jgi:hypothetical protein